MTDWPDVARALLGSWPSQVAPWGREAIAAYTEELRARGLTPDAALRAIRTADAGPAPTAPALAKLAHTDPDTPAWPEAYAAIYASHPSCGGRGVMWTAGGTAARLDRAYEIHPLLGAFVQAYGVTELQMLEVEHEEYGAVRRRDLEADWHAFCERNAHRDRAALAAGRTREPARGPKRIDAASALGISSPEREEQP